MLTHWKIATIRKLLAKFYRIATGYDEFRRWWVGTRMSVLGE